MAIKRDEILIHATLWMKLKNITLSGRNQIQKDDILCDPIHVKWSGKTTLETSRLVVVAWGLGTGSDCNWA